METFIKFRKKKLKININFNNFLLCIFINIYFNIIFLINIRNYNKKYIS